jgi:hypothetical protein
MAFVKVRLVKVPTYVSEEAVTPAASVAQVSVPAAAVIVCVPALVREIDEPWI